MTLKNLVDVTQRFLSNSGIMTDESKWDPLYIENLIHRYRGMAIVQAYSQTKSISPSWIQRYDLVYSEPLQESNILVEFKMPPVMILSNTQTGLIYFGGTKGVCPFRFVRTRSELSMYAAHRATSKSKYIRALYIDDHLEVRNDTMLENAFVEGVFQNPTDLPTFNRQIDNYPLDEALIPLMHDLMYKTEGRFLSIKPADTIPDNADSVNMPNTK